MKSTNIAVADANRRQLNTSARPCWAAFIAVALLGGALAPAQPANDNCQDAEGIAEFGLFVWDNVGATTDGVAHLCPTISRQANNDVWYCWESGFDGPVVVTTCGQTTIDTVVAVYDGCDCGAPLLACSDDACGLQSRATFNAVASQFYLIRVGSFSAAVTGSGGLLIESGILAGPILSPDATSAYYITEAATWHIGQAMAESLGGNLVTINSADENEFVRASVLRFDGADRRGWIGFTDQDREGDFTWISGEPVDFTNWGGGEPNNAGNNEHYTELLGGSGQWNDVPFNHALTRFALIEVNLDACTPPSVQQQPAPLEVLACDGQTINLNAAFAGSPAPQLQWQRAPLNEPESFIPLVDGVSNGAFISGAQTGDLTLTGVLPADTGIYHCLAFNACGNVYTQPVTLRVSLRGDMNCDGATNNFDIDPFVLALVDPPLYEATYPGCDPRNGDVNCDGGFNNFDIDPFVTLLISGP
ncbi:MAG: immunoglobulin domain-containing protein [Planctomycetia bacterium]|nr:MAG: immunoglobulin domain-containing protein [Planctomycetia bacterium]